MELPNLRTSKGTTTTLDASRTLFRVRASTGISDVLHALTMIQVSPVVGEGPTTAGQPMRMFVDVQRPAAVTAAASYDDSAGRAPPALVDTLNAKVRFELARIGLQFPAAKIDSFATARNTAGNPEWQTYVAIASVLRTLDSQIATGTLQVNTAQQVVGLGTLAASNTFTAGAVAIEPNVRTLLSKVVPCGAGTGEGPHCLIGGPTVRRKLQATATGQNGLSGMKLDPRTNRILYHYMGLPYYQSTATPDSSNTAKLYAANLGMTGLTLAHAYGTPETFGLQCDEQPLAGATGLRQLIMHGAWALVLWENEGLAELTGIDVTTGT